MTIDRDIAQAIKNIDGVSKRAVPRANAQALNRVAARVVSRSTKAVSSEVKLPQKNIRKRAEVHRARFNRQYVRIRVRLSPIPLISLPEARKKVMQNRTRYKAALPGRKRGGRFSSMTVARHHKFERVFLQRTRRGKWHILMREGDSPYPINVAQIRLREPLKKSYKAVSVELMRSDFPKELKAALRNQIRIMIVRS